MNSNEFKMPKAAVPLTENEMNSEGGGGKFEIDVTGKAYATRVANLQNADWAEPDEVVATTADAAQTKAKLGVVTA